MGINKIGNINIISNACSIRCVIICSCNLQGIIPRAASKQAPEIRPCSRSSGLGASPNLPSGSDPITLKYLDVSQRKVINNHNHNDSKK
ncbi:hypothetical protein MtrunA17_Chr2g0293531 [Medicago truncatula]|uniref:Uncharacterized protein n=1 Tax=Medicago truncatula TaxID=3880 RepID=A0A396J4I4_MEDTR|nr:hypothetical protein MtrunA17_Chr2g0293531 [Medicago truncatula]